MKSRARCTADTFSCSPLASLLSRLSRAGVAGAAFAIGGGACLAAASGDPSVWVSPILVQERAWNAFVGLLFVALGVGCLGRATSIARFLPWLALAPLLASALDVLAYYELVASGAIRVRRALPASVLVLFVTATCTWLALTRESTWNGRPREHRRLGPLTLTSIAAGGLAALLSLLQAFGSTDYRRAADCIVVLGARVYEDGSPSLSLGDRVAQGIELYRAGYAPTLVMSGGVDPGHGLSEARVMARLAEEAGVPVRAIVLDEAGADTRASAENCAELARTHGFRNALLVSHDYHLLRAKAAFARAGVEAFTVPAEETRPLARRHSFVLRECVAWLWYSMPAANG